MTQSPLVPVEGALARPRAAPLDDVPPFGREWTFRGMAGAPPGKLCVATLSTSCIDIRAPHRACRWGPIAAPASPAADAPVVPAAAAGGRAERASRTRGTARERRSLYATCWTIGALAIIGSLIALRGPSAGFAPARAVGTTEVVSDRAAPSTIAHRPAPTRSDSAAAAAQPTAAASVATIVRSSQPANGVTRGRTVPRPGAASDSRALARASHAQQPSARESHRSSRPGSETARATPPSAPRVAARPGRAGHTSNASHASTRARVAPPHEHAFDDPLTPIAIANALRADSPARTASTPAADFDWTSQLSHRRLTDRSPVLTH
jgi:hypothetical protein